MLTRFVLAAFTFLLLAPAGAAQEPYRQPPEPIRSILDAEPTPFVITSPDRQWLLLVERRSMPDISEVAAPELRLAGLRLNPRTGGRSRDMTFKGLVLRPVRGSETRRIAVPDGARIGFPAWSPDGRSIAFTVTGDSGIAQWVADVRTGEARQLTPRLSAVFLSGCSWAGSQQLICGLVPENRGAEPAAAHAPAGPVVQESYGRSAPNRTYQDLLQNPHDEALFEHYATAQLALVKLDGSVTPVGEPGIYIGASASPSGEYLLTTRAERPFSYVVPVWRFPRRIEVWDTTGRVVHQVAALPLQDDVPTPFDAVPTGPRSVEWRADAPATVVWVEALDGGDPARAAEKRDRLFMLAAPFSAQPATLLDVEFRVSGVEWGRPDFVLVNERWWKSRHTRTWVVNPAAPSASARLLLDYSYEDRYNHPGTFVTRRNAAGFSVLQLTRDGRSAYLAGAGASPEGDRPFLDRINLATARKARLWRTAAPYYESVTAVLDDDARTIITRREAVDEPPNYFTRDLRTGRLTRLTNFSDPAPQFAGVTKELITYTRKDGVALSATLYLPAGYDSSRGPIPFLFWAYPQEFRSAAAASQVTGSPHRFTRPFGSSHLFALTQGYGVLDGPTMPIVGEGDVEPNDSYVEQLVASAQAAVDKLVELGVADRQRIAIGGHSYGAFMTANLLAHSDLFRAGIARSGAYNRTLTPFGFQAEERNFWQATETYMRMSPFTHANRINEPILLIHGTADNNSGTFPIQSERLYAALQGNGGKVRLVMLPAESHGYAARESVGHTLWEMITWLDTHVKSAPEISSRGGPSAQSTGSP